MATPKATKPGTTRKVSTSAQGNNTNSQTANQGYMLAQGKSILAAVNKAVKQANLASQVTVKLGAAMGRVYVTGNSKANYNYWPIVHSLPFTTICSYNQRKGRLTIVIPPHKHPKYRGKPANVNNTKAQAHAKAAAQKAANAYHLRTLRK